MMRYDPLQADVDRLLDTLAGQKSATRRAERMTYLFAAICLIQSVLLAFLVLTHTPTP